MKITKLIISLCFSETSVPFSSFYRSLGIFFILFCLRSMFTYLILLGIQFLLTRHFLSNSCIIHSFAFGFYFQLSVWFCFHCQFQHSSNLADTLSRILPWCGTGFHLVSQMKRSQIIPFLQPKFYRWHWVLQPTTPPLEWKQIVSWSWYDRPVILLRWFSFHLNA